MRSRILIVEDEGISALHLESKLQEMGYEAVGTADSATEAIQMAGELRPDLVLMDIKLKGEVDGIEVGSRIQQKFGIPVVYLTAFSDEETVTRARGTAPFGYLIKPIQENMLWTTIEMALEKHRLQKQLEESNRELERFATIAAHDLKAPSRQVYLFLGLLLKEFGVQLNPKALEYIQMAKDSAMKMRDLIDDLLLHSQLMRKPAQVRDVDLNAIVATVIRELKPQVEGKQGRIRVSELPRVRGNESPLGRLMENLVSNAIKYNRNVPEVTISSKTDGDRVTISVADNGIGIDPGDTEKIFEMFHRLHPETEFPGTGIGLASCRKIVEIHGGRIWVESTPGAGSTFSFTLPLAK